MEFTQYKCPVCEKKFEPGDDVVVCPECGAPHHRECYEKNEHCFYEDKHSQDFSFEAYEAVNNQDSENASNECPVCRFNNPPGVMFCTRCGTPLHKINQNQAADNKNNTGQYTQQSQNYQSNRYGNAQTPPPFGFGAAGVPNFDPLAGMNSEDEIASGIKVGEMAKFVGKNTNYFLMVFNRVKEYGKAKFNFSAFLLSGLYFLYRKMYVLGIIFSLLIIATNVAATYIRLTPEYTSAAQYVLSFASKGSSITPGDALSIWNKIGIIYIPEILTWVRYGLMLFSGLLANRLYLNHSVKRIRKIKEQNNGEKIDEKLTAKGGVNLPFALSFGIAIFAVLMICEYIQLTSL